LNRIKEARGQLKSWLQKA